MSSADWDMKAGNAQAPAHSESRLVLSITRMTIHNGPGMRTLILFKGCPLHCIWCSTPESQKSEPELGVYPMKCIRCGDCIPVCPTKAISLPDGKLTVNRSLCNVCGKCVEVCNAKALEILGHRMNIGQLVTEVKKDEIVYKYSHGGVTISGGEPLFDTEFALNLLKAFKAEGINTGVDSCGQIPWRGLEPTLPYVDFFLWDIKHMDPEQHKKLTGVSNEVILSNAKAVAARGIPLYIRIPLIPGYNDSEENIRATCEFSLGLASVVQVDIMPLHHLGKARYDSLDRAYPIAGLALYTDEKVQEIKSLVESYGLKCVIQA
jgi:pyruvate formate lyase activating enzyme